MVLCRIYRVLTDRDRFIILLLAAAVVLLSSCGRKAPPTLKEFAVPADPSDLKAVHREGKILLSWSHTDKKAHGLKGFEVIRSSEDKVERRVTVAYDQSFFIDDVFSIDVTYTYRVVARSPRDVLSPGLNQVTITPRSLPVPPDAVRYRIRPDSIELSWKGSGEGVCYNIYRTTERTKVSDAPLNGKPVCAAVFNDTALLPSKTVYYIIRPLHDTPARDEGSASPEVEIDPSQFVPSPPSDLRFVRVDDKRILMWKESEEVWIQGYRIYRKFDGEDEFKLLGESKAPTFTDLNRTDGKTWYMIRTMGPAAESPALVGVALP